MQRLYERVVHQATVVKYVDQSCFPRQWLIVIMTISKSKLAKHVYVETHLGVIQLKYQPILKLQLLAIWMNFMKLVIITFTFVMMKKFMEKKKEYKYFQPNKQIN